MPNLISYRGNQHLQVKGTSESTGHVVFSSLSKQDTWSLLIGQKAMSEAGQVWTIIKDWPLKCLQNNESRSHVEESTVSLK